MSLFIQGKMLYKWLRTNKLKESDNSDIATGENLKVSKSHGKISIIPEIPEIPVIPSLKYKVYIHISISHIWLIHSMWIGRWRGNHQGTSKVFLSYH